MISKKTWKEFQDCKLLWWVNRSLHIFGWAIVLEVQDDGAVTGAYPARVKFRGFDGGVEQDGFRGLSDYMFNESSELANEANQ